MTYNLFMTEDLLGLLLISKHASGYLLHILTEGIMTYHFQEHHQCDVLGVILCRHES